MREWLRELWDNPTINSEAESLARAVADSPSGLNGCLPIGASAGLATLARSGSRFKQGSSLALDHGLAS
jgi:hypothetical protein